VGFQRKGGTKNNFKVFDLRRWKDRVALS